MFFQVFVCPRAFFNFIILSLQTLIRWNRFFSLGEGWRFFFAREIWSNPVFCCRNDAISRDVGLRSIFLRRRTEDSIVSSKKSGRSIWCQAYRAWYLQYQVTSTTEGYSYVWFLKGLLITCWNIWWTSIFVNPCESYTCWISKIYALLWGVSFSCCIYIYTYIYICICIDDI